MVKRSHFECPLLGEISLTLCIPPGVRGSVLCSLNTCAYPTGGLAPLRSLPKSPPTPQPLSPGKIGEGAQNLAQAFERWCVPPQAVVLGRSVT